MAITRRVTQVYAGPSAAGQILAPTIDVGLGVPAAMAGTVSQTSIFGGDTLSNVTAYCGFRVVNAMNLSSRQRVGFGVAHNALNRNACGTYSNGGIRIVFQDSFGNWSSFHIYGRDYSAFSTAELGAMGGNTGFGTTTPRFFIDKSRTPDQSSGVLDWTSIVAFEVHFRPVSSGRMQLSVGQIITSDEPIHTGSVSGANVFADVQAAYANSSGGNWWMNFVSSANSFVASGQALS